MIPPAKQQLMNKKKKQKRTLNKKNINIEKKRARKSLQIEIQYIIP